MEDRPSINVFNMATQSLIRIDNLLIELNNYNTDRDLFMIGRVLSTLYKEVYPYLSKPERKEGEKYLEDIREGVLGLKNNVVSFTAYFPFIIDEFDRWQRSMLHKHKLLMATSEDPADILGEKS